MKKISCLIAIMAIYFSAIAQHTVPRYGTSPAQNKTYSTLPLYFNATLTDTLGATVDTLHISPNAYTNHYVVTVKDSAVLSFKTIKNSWFGDNMVVTLENTSGSGHFVNFLGDSGLATAWGMSVTGTKISLVTAKSATLTFFFDGVLWNEVSRSIR